MKPHRIEEENRFATPVAAMPPLGTVILADTHSNDIASGSPHARE